MQVSGPKFVVKCSYHWEGSRRIGQIDGTWDTIEEAQGVASDLENDHNPDGHSYWAEEKQEDVETSELARRLLDLVEAGLQALRIGEMELDGACGTPIHDELVVVLGKLRELKD